MKRVFVTGDCHGELARIWRFIKKFELDAEDSIIVAGDVGIFWNKDQRDAKYIIKNYEANCNGVHLYWIPGNHEDYDIIDSWGCSRNQIYDNSEHIHYCPRGLVKEFEINGQNKKIMFIGGADSTDKHFRREHISWWPQEQIQESDIKDCIENNEGVDYIITHCCPYEVFKKYTPWLVWGGIEIKDVDHTSEQMLDKVAAKIACKKHIFGHYHIDKQFDEKYRCVLNDFIELE